MTEFRHISAGQRASLFERLAGWSYRRRWWALVLWVAVLAGVTLAAQAVGSSYHNDFSLPGTESQQALDTLKERAPVQAGATVQIVVQKPDGVATSQRRRDDIMTPLRVLIVDDDDLMRAGLRAVLSSDESISVVGEAADGREAIRWTRHLQPDVALMDIRMPNLDGIAATGEIIAAAPRARILILTTFEDDDYIFGALSAGASGFLLKRTQPEQLINAIHTIAAGESLL